MKNSRARIVSAGVAMASVVATAIGVMLPSAHATSPVTTTRFAGATRYDTARLIGTYKAKSSSTFAFGTPTQAVLVSGDNFPDALAANFLAGAYKSPTFLTAKATLRPEALQGLQDLGVKNVTIVGGPEAVSSSEDASLSANGITPTRVAGVNRDDTAATVAQAPGTTVGTYRDKGLTAIVAADTTDHYVDALAGGPLAWAGHFPILLTGTSSLAPEAAKALQALKIAHVLILGGTAAIDSNVEATIVALGITTERLEGTNRQLTAIAVANAANQYLTFGLATIGLALGNNFPDALAGGAIGGLTKSPILLTGDTTTLTTDTHDYVRANNGSISQLLVFGGPNAIADSVVTEASSTAQCNSAHATTTAGLPIIGGPARAAASTTTAAGATTSTSSTSTSLPPCQTTTTGVRSTSTTNGGTPTTAGATTTTASPLPGA
ncbi:MAG: cell wall-binding repeat-containing protein [Acidimicrobiales bacterium]